MRNATHAKFQIGREGEGEGGLGKSCFNKSRYNYDYDIGYK